MWILSFLSNLRNSNTRTNNMKWFSFEKNYFRPKPTHYVISQTKIKPLQIRIKTTHFIDQNQPQPTSHLPEAASHFTHSPNPSSKHSTYRKTKRPISQQYFFYRLYNEQRTIPLSNIKQTYDNLSIYRAVCSSHGRKRVCAETMT